jgi:pimeloyl-ACP methyl ester carboxylesterase
MLINFEYEELFFENDGIRLHAVAAGPKLGPVVVLLHGFPEFWYSWHNQIGPLAAAGFRVVALDQRGYNLSSKPPAVSDYAVPLLARDVLAIADQLGCERFYVAGHDWGAAVAWAVALRYPQRLHKLAIVNVPHPAAMMHTLRTNPRQWLRSWYVLFFQLPWLTRLTNHDF